MGRPDKYMRLVPLSQVFPRRVERFGSLRKCTRPVDSLWTCVSLFIKKTRVYHLERSPVSRNSDDSATIEYPCGKPPTLAPLQPVSTTLSQNSSRNFQRVVGRWWLARTSPSGALASPKYPESSAFAAQKRPGDFPTIVCFVLDSYLEVSCPDTSSLATLESSNGLEHVCVRLS